MNVDWIDPNWMNFNWTNPDATNRSNQTP